MIRAWSPILPGWRSFYFLRTLANERSASGIGVSTSCGAVPTRGALVFIPGLSEL